jgi:hypothetical protein
MRKTLLGFLSLVCILASPSAWAGITPLSVAIVAPVQFPPADYAIYGFRVSALWGKHRIVDGFDFGAIGNISITSFAGIAASGIFNLNQGSATVTGLQVAGIANMNEGKTSVLGLQVAAITNYQPAASSVTGVQLSLANVAHATNIYGFQIGLYNKALNVYGFQIGLINSTDTLHGFQLGLINFNRLGLFSVCPGINFGI